MPEPGWYPDPIDRRRARYWDGWRWTESVSGEAPDAPSEVVQPEGDGEGGQPDGPQHSFSDDVHVFHPCPICHSELTMAATATSVYCPTCSRDMYFLQCAACSGVAVANAIVGRDWTCPSCNLSQPARIGETTASGHPVS